MMSDEIKNYKKYNCFNYQCCACGKKTHLINECPKINYIPDRQFLIKKLNYFNFQERRNTKNIRFKNKYHALLQLKNTKFKAENFFLKSYDEAFSLDGSIDEKDLSPSLRNKIIPFEINEIISDEEEEEKNEIVIF